MSTSSGLFLTNRTLNFAHRGFTKNAPENSLAAFKAAIELGVDGIELDVRTCKSGEVVVFHDPTLARMTNGRGFVKNKTLAELKRLSLKQPNGGTSETIPTLSEVIELTKGRVFLNIEIKTNGLPRNKIENKVIEIIRYYGITRETVVSSFNPIVVRRLRKLDTEVMTGYLVDNNFTVRKSEIPLTRFAGARAIHLEKRLAKPKLLSKMHAAGFHSVVWSVNEPETMKRLIELGVNVIITDRPDLLKKLTSQP